MMLKGTTFSPGGEPSKKLSKNRSPKHSRERVLLTFGYIPHLWHTSVKAYKAGKALWCKMDAVTQQADVILITGSSGASSGAAQVGRWQLGDIRDARVAATSITPCIPLLHPVFLYYSPYSSVTHRIPVLHPPLQLVPLRSIIGRLGTAVTAPKPCSAAPKPIINYHPLHYTWSAPLNPVTCHRSWSPHTNTKWNTNTNTNMAFSLSSNPLH